jgi:hypothetical protein
MGGSLTAADIAATPVFPERSPAGPVFYSVNGPVCDDSAFPTRLSRTALVTRKTQPAQKQHKGRLLACFTHGARVVGAVNPVINGGIAQFFCKIAVPHLFDVSSA